MPLSILARLRDGRYDAGGMRPDSAEWPPHPGRVFCALVASAEDDRDWRALRWLEQADAPEVWAAREFTEVKRDGFVVTNDIDPKSRSQRHPYRVNLVKTRFSAEPADPEFAIVWPKADPEPELLTTLSRLARRVPYLGRTTSPVALRVTDQPVEVRAGWARFIPTQLGEPAVASLRVPHPGYTEQLREAYAHGRRAWQAPARIVPYRLPEPRKPVEPGVPPFGELLVFGFGRGTVKPVGESVLAVTARLRAAVLARIGVDVPPQVSGHGADDRRHVAYLALPHVGHQYADGRLLGVAIAVPSDLPGDAYSRLWEAVIEAPLSRLTLRRDQVLPLEPALSEPAAWGLVPERWTAADRGGARTWVTATPMMLDRFPKRARGDEGILAEIRRSLVRAGYPEPAEWRFSPAPLLKGALHRPRPDTMPSNRPAKPMVHVQVTFERPVVGPVIAGAMRYVGLGLFVPVAEGR